MMSIDPTGPASSCCRSTRWILCIGLPMLGIGLLAAFLVRFVLQERAVQAADSAFLAEAVAQAQPVQRGDDERNRAPELDGGVAWLNTASPVRLRDLRGKIVLLDFWTLCCINCIHTLPDLAKLEKKYANQLVVIGVHSAKFENERNSESIRKAILRYEISHPVVNDADMKIWRR